MQNMIYIEESDAALKALGRRLREARVKRNDSQSIFAARLGVSVPTLRDMESGAGTVSVAHWINAMWLLQDLSSVDRLLKQNTSLIELAEMEKAQQRNGLRQRARRRLARVTAQ